MTPVLFAIGAAVCGTFNDLVYRKNKINSAREKVWLFYFLAAISSAAYCFLYITLSKGSFHFDLPTALLGAMIGVVSFAAYILFLFSFDGVNTSVTITIFRMNLIPGIILAMIFLNEAITLRRVFGIVLCIVGMLIFSYQKTEQKLKIKFLVLSICACLFCGVLNYANKVAAIEGMDSFYVMFWRFSTVAMISIVPLLRKPPEKFLLSSIKYPMISGFLLMMSVFCTLAALKNGDVSLVIPITQMSFIVTALISWIVFKERMTLSKLLGIVCGLLAVVLIA